MTEAQRMVKLKNGKEEPANLVAVTMVSIEALMESDPISFYEFVMKSRDAKHKVWSQQNVEKLTREKLTRAGLMGIDGHVHGSIANIVASGVTGDGLNMKIVSPVESVPAAPQS